MPKHSTRRSTYRPPAALTLGQALTIWAGTLTACGIAIVASLVVTGRLG